MYIKNTKKKLQKPTKNMLKIYSGMAFFKRLQVLTILFSVCWLKLTYGIIDDDEYNSIYNLQLQSEQNHEVGRFPFLMPNVRPKTVSKSLHL